MEELSLHILDIVQNSIDAEATRVSILIEEDTEKDTLKIIIEDNGKGIPEEVMEKIKDPFFSTKQKKTGLGISLLAQSAAEAEGSMNIRSEPGKGTTVEAVFKRSHIDRKPLGDLTSTLISLIAGNPDVDFYFEYRIDKNCYIFDTSEVKKMLEEVPINYPGVLSLLREEIRDGIERLRKGGRI